MELFWTLFWKIIEENGKLSANGRKHISIATYKMRCKHIAREIHRLRSGDLVKSVNGKIMLQPRFKLSKPENLKRKHVDALISDWTARGLSVAYLHNMVSMLRVFCGWLGKQNMIPGTVDVITDNKYKRRVQVATKDKSWSGCGVDVETLLNLIAQSEPRVALVLELMHVFALRLKEAALLCPWLADQDVYLDIARGTKGGRDRTHVINTIEQRDLIRRVKAVVEDKNACLIPRGRSYRSFQNHVYYVLRQHGITRKAIGTSSHGLRHGRLNDQYQEIAGAPSPVRGGQPGDVNPETDRFARQ
jgi:site-specific recombinase XerC